MAPRRRSKVIIPPWPTCFLCGVSVPHISPATWSEYDQFLKKDSKWKSCWGEPNQQHMLVPSHEVEEAYLAAFPYLWSCFFRAIIMESRSRYRLTGINIIQMAGGSSTYYAPSNPAIARINGKKGARYDYRTFTRFDAATVERNAGMGRKLMGYFVHAHCWALFGRVKLHKALPLTRLIRTCRKNWRNNEMWGLNDFHYDGSYKIVHQNQTKLDFTYGCNIYQNPLVVPAVQEVFDRASARRGCMSKIQAHHLVFHSSNLPLEIATLIAEWVCPVKHTVDDINNAWNMLMVFQWKLPDHFWRERLNQHLFIELSTLEHPLDWPLCLALMRIVSNRNCLANRERVLAVMHALAELAK